MSKNKIMLEFTGRTPFAGGASFGDVGPYERLLGMVSISPSTQTKRICRLFAT